ncbi:hypothetical protein GF327_03310 [Candidatus Woesearchaeota archaeon]|nr:hypothetical protein [Candidatus Woesearchaeota archaeon]
MEKKADLTINTIFVILVTIISIILLLGIFSTKLPVFAKKIYCKTFFFIHSATFIPKDMRADQDFCVSTKTLAPPVIINEPDKLNITVLGHAVACWEEMEKGKYNENFLCYEITLGPKITSPVELTEENITQILINNDLCNFLENNDTNLNCGKKDQINWSLGERIYPRQNILIEYDNDNKRIIIS